MQSALLYNTRWTQQYIACNIVLWCSLNADDDFLLSQLMDSTLCQSAKTGF